MSWNYRILKKLNSNNELEYGIYEVFYDENEKVKYHTIDSVVPVCQSLDDLKYEMENRIMKAFQS